MPEITRHHDEEQIDDKFYSKSEGTVENLSPSNYDTHRWSGWPGAWCLDCGCDDPFELAMAHNNIEFEQLDGGIEMISIKESCYEDYKEGLTKCPCPGSNNYNPYLH